jgi:hypothetical protein
LLSEGVTTPLGPSDAFERVRGQHVHVAASS